MREPRRASVSGRPRRPPRRRPGRSRREDGQPPQDRAFGRVQQVPGPVDDGAQGLLARQYGPAAAGQQPEAVVETVGDLPRGEQPEAGGGQFDGQRQSVEPPADLRDGLRVGRRIEVGPHRAGPLGEQPVSGLGRQRLDRAYDFTRHPEGLPAGGEDGQVRAAREQFLGEVAAAAITCSQLSRRRSMRRRAQCSASRTSGSPPCGRRP